MKRIVLALALLAASVGSAAAQCNGVFPNNTVCGNITGSGNLPRPTNPSAFLGAAGGSDGQIQYNNAGALGGFTMSGDATTNTGTGALTLATVNANVGSFGSTSQCTTFTVNAKGLITAASAGACALAATQITYTAPWTNAAAYTQHAVNNNVVRMTDFMGTTTCDGVEFIAGTGGVSTTTLTVASVQVGTLAAGMTIATSTGPVQRTILSQLTGTPGGAGTYQMSSAATVAAGQPWLGGTDQGTNITRFLAAVSAQGAAGATASGIFAPGRCFTTTSPTITLNSSYDTVNYHLSGYGTIIFPDPSAFLTGFVVARGTFLTHGDESRTITVEGLSVNARNNSLIQWGFNAQDTRVYFVRVNCFAGDDGTVNAQVNFACYYWQQRDSTDPNTGAFYGKLFQSTCKGNGVGASAVPICVRADGSGGNALVIAENAFAQGGYGIRLLNPCATVNANCAYHPNNVVVRDNNIELFSQCLEFRTSVPALSTLVGGVVEGNTFELCSVSDIDISTFTQQSNANQALALGPNTGIGTVAAISNTNSIQVILPNAKQWP